MMKEIGAAKEVDGVNKKIAVVEQEIGAVDQ